MFKSSRQEFKHSNSYNSNNFITITIVMIIIILQLIKNPGIVGRCATRGEASPALFEN